MYKYGAILPSAFVLHAISLDTRSPSVALENLDFDLFYLHCFLVFPQSFLNSRL